jgi:hypothetical protein
MHTFKFSTCLSPGDPRKSNKYGGNSESRACANIIRCPFGIAHSGVVSSNVVIDSCHMRRFVWMEEAEMSNLTKEVSLQLVIVDYLQLPRGKYINTLQDE